MKSTLGVFGDGGNFVFHQVEVLFHGSGSETLLMQPFLPGFSFGFDLLGLLLVAGRFGFVEFFFSLVVLLLVNFEGA